MPQITIDPIILQVGKNDILREEVRNPKKDLTELFTLEKLTAQRFVSGPLPARGTDMYIRLLSLNR